MQLILSVFLKAAKRCASRQGISLAQAQENLSSDFGFRNFDSARKALEREPSLADVPPTGESAPSSDQDEGHDMVLGQHVVRFSPRSPTASWMGLSPDGFSTLWLSLSPMTSSEGRSWLEKGHRVLDAVYRDLCGSKDGSLTMREISAATTLESIERRYVQLATSDSPPYCSRGISRYLDSGLPAYKPARLLSNKIDAGAASHQPRAQDSIAQEQHDYRTSQFLPILDKLEALEALYLAGNPEVLEIVRTAAHGDDTARKRLKECIAAGENLMMTRDREARATATA